MKRNEKIAWMAMLLALAFVLSFLERMLSFEIPVPGVKLGLANLAVLMAIYTLGVRGALITSLSRIFLDGMMFGNAYRMMYSLAGGILSLAVMALLKRSGAFSIIGVSMAGGVSHNVGQLIMAMLVVETYAVGYYLPVLLIAGLITGTLIGIAGREMLKRLDLAVLN